MKYRVLKQYGERYFCQWKFIFWWNCKQGDDYTVEFPTFKEADEYIKNIIKQNEEENNWKTEVIKEYNT